MLNVETIVKCSIVRSNAHTHSVDEEDHLDASISCWTIQY